MRIFLASCFFIVSVAMSYAQVCNSELKVEKNRNYKSADEDGAAYWLELTNKSAAPTNFTITTKNLETSCSNNTFRSQARNVNLDVSILGQDARTPLSNSIRVAGGQTYRFRIVVTAPAGTPTDRWSCVEVQANAGACRVGSISTVLSVYVPENADE